LKLRFKHNVVGAFEKLALFKFPITVPVK
jgi:hypothetical protein